MKGAPDNQSQKSKREGNRRRTPEELLAYYQLKAKAARVRIIERKQAEETRENILIGKLMIRVVDSDPTNFVIGSFKGRDALARYLWEQADERERKAIEEWATKAPRAPVLTEEPEPAPSPAAT